MGKKKFQWSRGEEDSEGQIHFTERVNRKEAARANDRIFSLGKSLVALKADQLDPLPLSDDVREAIAQARRLRARGGVRSAMRRQLLFVAGALRNEDEEALEALFDATGT